MAIYEKSGDKQYTTVGTVVGMQHGISVGPKLIAVAHDEAVELPPTTEPPTRPPRPDIKPPVRPDPPKPPGIIDRPIKPPDRPILKPPSDELPEYRKAAVPIKKVAPVAKVVLLKKDEPKPEPKPEPEKPKKKVRRVRKAKAVIRKSPKKIVVKKRKRA